MSWLVVYPDNRLSIAVNINTRASEFAEFAAIEDEIAALCLARIDELGGGRAHPDPGTTRMSIGRMALLAVAIEGTAIIILVLVVGLFGPGDPVAAQAYAERLGYWVGPIAGFTLCVGGGWLVARRLQTSQIRRGALLGAMVATIDVAILVASGATFQPVLVVSNLGRVVAGALGGLMASQGSGPAE